MNKGEPGSATRLHKQPVDEANLVNEKEAETEAEGAGSGAEMPVQNPKARGIGNRVGIIHVAGTKVSYFFRINNDQCLSLTLLTFQIISISMFCIYKHS